jgi:hypothetical protein
LRLRAIPEGGYAYQSKARDATPLIMRIKEITATRFDYGYRRVHVMLKREGWRTLSRQSLNSIGNYLSASVTAFSPASFGVELG